MPKIVINTIDKFNTICKFLIFGGICGVMFTSIILWIIEKLLSFATVDKQSLTENNIYNFFIIFVLIMCWSSSGLYLATKIKSSIIDNVLVVLMLIICGGAQLATL